MPVLHGKLVRVPDSAAGPAELGMYGLFLMMLFRPHRAVAELTTFALGDKAFQGTEEDG